MKKQIEWNHKFPLLWEMQLDEENGTWLTGVIIKCPDYFSVTIRRNPGGLKRKIFHFKGATLEECIKAAQEAV